MLPSAFRQLRQNQGAVRVLLGSEAHLSALQSRALQTQAAIQPEWGRTRISATGERASTVVVHGVHTITVDCPTDAGGHGSAPGPVAHFLGSLVGSAQSSLHAVASEHNVNLGQVKWTAEALMDANGVHGESDSPALFESVRLGAEVETDASHASLKEMRELATQRCIVFNTLKAAGVSMKVEFYKKLNFKSSMGTHIP